MKTICKTAFKCSIYTRQYTCHQVLPHTFTETNLCANTWRCFIKFNTSSTNRGTRKVVMLHHVWLISPAVLELPLPDVSCIQLSIHLVIPLSCCVLSLKTTKPGPSMSQGAVQTHVPCNTLSYSSYLWWSLPQTRCESIESTKKPHMSMLDTTFVPACLYTEALRVLLKQQPALQASGCPRLEATRVMHGTTNTCESHHTHLL